MANFDAKYLTHSFQAPSQNAGVLALGGWDVPRIKEARSAHLMGRFAQSAGLAQAMRSDGRVYNAWGQRADLPSSLAFSVDAPDGTEGDPLASTIQQDAARLFRDDSTACPPPTRTALFSGGAMMGAALAQLIWTPRADGSWIDVRLEPWPAEATGYDRTKKCYQATTRADGVVDVHHGDGKWLVVEPYGIASYLAGAIVPLALSFADRGWGIRDRSNFGGAHGSPGLIGKLPKGEAPEGELGTAYLAEMAKMQQPRARMLEPDGAATRFLEAVSNSYQVFGQIITGSASDIDLILLGQDGTTSNSGGTYTKALVLQGVLYNLIAHDVGAASTAITSGLLVPYAAVNRGRPELAARLRWHVPRPLEQERLKAQADQHAAYRSAVKEYRALKIPVDEAALAAQYGVRVPLAQGAVWPVAVPVSPASEPAPAAAPMPPPSPAPAQAPP
jgi:hypothetical protein